MISVLVNAYAVSPNWGSEPGMGWNWIVNIAKYCNVYVITEGEWQSEIEAAVEKLPHKKNLHFYYNPVPEKIRKMCWNQGDWRFYWHYKKWQRRTLDIAEDIIKHNKIDVIHQLNMVGFREPGYLWKIKNIPFVWGPICGMDMMPLGYLQGVGWKQKQFNRLKNIINGYQRKYKTRVLRALDRSQLVISATKGAYDFIRNCHNKDTVLMSETGCDLLSVPAERPIDDNSTFNVVWVGRFIPSKKLDIALKSIQKTHNENIIFHVIGTGNEREVDRYKDLSEALGISPKVVWHGKVEHSRTLELMANSDLLFFTSIMEATSTVVPEAISVGLPILSFNTCGFGPIVKDFAGFAIEMSNPENSINEFAEQINMLERNRCLLQQIRARQLVGRQELTWDKKAIFIVDHYKRILSEFRTEK